MLETAHYYATRRVKGSLILAAGVTVYSAFIVWYFSALEGVDIDQMTAEMPAAMKEAFGIETMATIEGFLAVQFFNFIWLLGLGLYFAYVGAGLIASDIERERMDLLLSLPISHSRFLVEKFSSLLVPLFVLNIVVGSAVYLFVNMTGESIDLTNLVMAHLLSIPYLLVCATVGVVLSVVVSRAGIAQKAAIALVFVLYMIESLVGDTDNVDRIQYLSPTYYYEPTPILLDGSFAYDDVVILLISSLFLLGLSAVIFSRRDI